jgi:hypothetical protein
MWYEVSMLDVGNNILGFITILKGYSSFGTNAVRVLKIAHPQKGVEGNNYSFAILIESFGLFTDSSYWLLFYNFATDYSGTGGSYYKRVLEELKSIGKRVHLTEVRVDEEALLKYLESHRVRALVTQGQELARLSESLKGGLFELFVAHLLSRMGFVTYLRYRNSKLLGRKEIDVISAKVVNRKMKIVIAEAFGSFPKDVQQITNELTIKLSIMQQHYTHILKEIGVSYDDEIDSTPVIQAWVITYDATQKKKLAPSVYVYDIKKVNELCKDFGVNFDAFSHFLRRQKRINFSDIY